MNLGLFPRDQVPVVPDLAGGLNGHATAHSFPFGSSIIAIWRRDRACELQLRTEEFSKRTWKIPGVAWEHPITGQSVVVKDGVGQISHKLFGIVALDTRRNRYRVFDRMRGRNLDKDNLMSMQLPKILNL